MFLSLTLRVTVAPASRHTRANVLSVETARLFNRPECERLCVFQNVILAATLASGLGQKQRKAQPLQHECPEMHGLHLELWCSEAEDA